MASGHVKKTLTLPRELVEKLHSTTQNLSAYVAAACREKLEADERKAIELEMIERCRVRYQEDLDLADEFFAAEQQVWDSNPS